MNGLSVAFRTKSLVACQNYGGGVSRGGGANLFHRNIIAANPAYAN
jgi:hypothetical protein